MLCAIPMLTVLDDEPSEIEMSPHRPTFTPCDLSNLRANRLREVPGWVTVVVHPIWMLGELGADTRDAACHGDESFVDRHSLEVVGMGHEDGVELQGEQLISIAGM